MTAPIGRDKGDVLVLSAAFSLARAFAALQRSFVNEDIRNESGTTMCDPDFQLIRSDPHPSDSCTRVNAPKKVSGPIQLLQISTD